MTSVLRQIRSLNGLEGRTVAEPFAGGAGASLALLYQNLTHNIYINDFDPAIHHFWWSVLHRSKAFLEYLDACSVSVDEWKRWRTIYHDPRVSRLQRGFSAFYLNRTNRSGIIEDGSVIGGLEQSGRWKIDARFNKATLRRRLELLAEHRREIQVSGQDGIEFIGSLESDSTLYFIDPPYYAKGPTLYMNALGHAYHERLAERLHEMPRGA